MKSMDIQSWFCGVGGGGGGGSWLCACVFSICMYLGRGK
jgi:hypothetical protein